MRIGIMADTHDNLPLIARAVMRMNEEAVDLVLHAGDFVSPFVIPALSELDAPLTGVFGNNDGDRQLLARKCSGYEKIEIRGAFAHIVADGLAIGMLHGDDDALLEALVDRCGFDVVVHGHTHIAAIRRAGSTLTINPGEVCGYLTGRSTVALLDTGTREGRILSL
ncbi:MAG: metallophosphoesterase [Methanomicrobiaceae archaeon]|nr:metallophosphoesterase [Methanomicrobiaceae archaeon]